MSRDCSDDEKHHRRHRKRSRHRSKDKKVSSSDEESKSRRHKHRSHGHDSRKSREYSSKERSKSRSPKRSRSKHKSRKRSRSKHDSRSRSRSRHESESRAKERYERLRRQKEKAQTQTKVTQLIDAHEEEERQKRLIELAKTTAKDGNTIGTASAAGSSIWDDEYLGYTNSDNPFGDANLLKTFVWSKKYEKLGIKDIDPEEIEKQNRVRLEKNKHELEMVKQRRLEREREREARAEELSRQQREKEALQFKEWEKQEDTFHLKQAKLRSQLRIREGRAKPIDLLARYIDMFGVKEENPEDTPVEPENTPFDLAEPYLFLNGLRMSDMEDLQEDIKVYMELDHGGNMSYWKDLQVIVDDELNKLKKFTAAKQSGLERREGINAAVNNEVASIFKGKTPSQLNALQVQIETKINSGEEGIDISYWESLLSQLKAHMARARLRERHQENIRRSLEQMKSEQGVISNENDDSNSVHASTSSQQEVEQVQEVEEVGPSTSTDQKPEETEATSLEKYIEEYEKGDYSPQLIPLSQLEAGTVVLDALEDWNKLLEHRDRLFNPASRPKRRQMTDEEAAFEKEARRGMTEEESVFSSEEVIKQDRSVASWSDKYRPRKPRYFNRVHTGFEWNKYNQTHYDVDNPPPKIVQGYKFNIFYPDLIDKQKTPKYTVTPCKDNRDFAVIRFSAGPPYEDIAFKIVNREWNYSYKSGFRCQFHNNILQLWFHFKRYRYRR